MQARYFPREMGVLPPPGEWRLTVAARRDSIAVFGAWFHAGLCVPAHPFLLEFLEEMGLELAHLHPSAILHLNVFRWLCEMATDGPPTTDLLFHFFRMEVKLLKVSDSSFESIFSFIFLRLRRLFAREYPIMPSKSHDSAWRAAEWFYLSVFGLVSASLGHSPRMMG